MYVYIYIYMFEACIHKSATFSGAPQMFSAAARLGHRDHGGAPLRRARCLRHLLLRRPKQNKQIDKQTDDNNNDKNKQNLLLWRPGRCSQSLRTGAKILDFGGLDSSIILS